MMELGSRQNMTDMDTKRARGKFIVNALVCQLCWIFLCELVGNEKFNSYELSPFFTRFKSSLRKTQSRTLSQATMMQYTQQQRLAPEVPDESALYSPIYELIELHIPWAPSDEFHLAIALYQVSTAPIFLSPLSLKISQWDYHSVPVPRVVCQVHHWLHTYSELGTSSAHSLAQ